MAGSASRPDCRALTGVAVAGSRGVWDDLDRVEALSKQTKDALSQIEEAVTAIRARMLKQAYEFYGALPDGQDAGAAAEPSGPTPPVHSPDTTAQKGGSTPAVVIDSTTFQPVPVQPIATAPAILPAPAAPWTTMGVKFTGFGDRADEAAGNWEQLSEERFKPSPKSGARDAFVALPTRQRGIKVMLQDAKPDGTPLGPWVGPFWKGDTGPWLDGTNGKGVVRDEWEDRYWETKTRPKVEFLKTDYRGRKTNGAGIDLTPAAIAAVKQYANPGVPFSDLALRYWDKPVNGHVNVQVIGIDNETRITPHFTVEEMSHSDLAIKYGIDNSIPSELMSNARRLCEFLEAVRAKLGRGFTPNQAYRSPKLTEPMRKEGYKPATNSQHFKALAADLPRTQEFYEAITAAARVHTEPVLVLIETSPDHIHVALESSDRSEVRFRDGAAPKAWERAVVLS